MNLKPCGICGEEAEISDANDQIEHRTDRKLVQCSNGACRNASWGPEYWNKNQKGKTAKTRAGHDVIIFMPDNGMGKMLGAIRIAPGWWVGETWHLDGSVLLPLAEAFPEFDLVSEVDSTKIGAAYHAEKLKALTSICDNAVLLALKDARIKELEKQLKYGTEDGSRCNRRCDGVMVLEQPENCSCHLGAPCGPCENMRPECSMCGEVAE